MLNYQFSPLGKKFPRPLTSAGDRSVSRFKKSWPQILDDLEKETDLLDAREDSVVIRTLHESYDIRNDGRLAGNAREPKHPALLLLSMCRALMASLDGCRWHSNATNSRLGGRMCRPLPVLSKPCERSTDTVFRAVAKRTLITKATKLCRPPKGS